MQRPLSLPMHKYCFSVTYLDVVVAVGAMCRCPEEQNHTNGAAVWDRNYFLSPSYERKVTWGRGQQESF